MAEQELKALVAQGLQALRAGGEVAKKATGEIQGDASNAELKSALQDRNRTSEQWAQRIERAMQEAGGSGGAASEQGNPVLEAHYEVSRRIRQNAKEAESRDLGIIASGQLALHYWIAAFGTLRTYAARLGMGQTEQDLQSSLDEAKQADEHYTQLAQQIMGGSGSGSGSSGSDDRGQQTVREALTGTLAE